ncbi:MAG: hypothetical protein IJY36_05915, partial [Coprobacter sp.]|nr:hypothetical protein [Coprobacter sp.]
SRRIMHFMLLSLFFNTIFCVAKIKIEIYIGKVLSENFVNSNNSPSCFSCIILPLAKLENANSSTKHFIKYFC